MLLKRNLTSEWLLLLAVALLLLPVAVRAQDAGEYVSLNNGYIGASVYRSGDAESGLFSIWNVLGDQSSAEDDHATVIGQGRVFIMSDIYTGEEADRTLQWATFEKGGGLGVWGDIESDGVWVIQPQYIADERCIRGTWAPTAVEDDYPLYLLVEQEVKAFHDMIRFKWTITNNDGYAHQIGLKVCGDIETEPQNGGVLDQLNVVSIPGFSLIEERTVVPGAALTDTRYNPYLEAYNSATDPGRGVKVFFQGMNATQPDVVGIDEYSVLASSTWSYINDDLNMSLTPKAVWEYEPFPQGSLISSNLGYGAFWKPVRVAPGASRTIIHYVGNPASTHSVSFPTANQSRYAAALSGPRVLKYTPGQAGGSSFTPSTFTISASVDNLDKYTNLTNCRFTLILPAGLRLDPTENAYTKTLSQIAPFTEGSVSWLVTADGTRSGLLTYNVAVNTYPMGSTVLKREIHVPATALRTFYSGWQQISVPFGLTDGDPSTALGLPPSSVLKFYRYDVNLPQTSPTWPYGPVDVLQPGEAYWLKLAGPATTAMPAGNHYALQWSDPASSQIAVNQGWNMVSTPFVYASTAGEMHFFHEIYGDMSYDEAISRGYVSRTLWWWNTAYNTWNWSTQRTARINPWQGYWIRIINPGIRSVTITPAAQVGAEVGG